MPFLAKVVDAGLQSGHRPRMLIIFHNPLALFLQQILQVFGPHVAIVDVAQEGLHFLDRSDELVEAAIVDRLANLHRIAQPLRRDPHRVVAVLIFRVAEAALVSEHLVQPRENVLLRLTLDELTLDRNASFAELLNQRLDVFAHIARRGTSQKSVDRLDHARLDLFAPMLQLDQQPSETRKVLRFLQPRQNVADERYLHVLIASVAQVLGQPARSLAPTLDLLAREALAEHFQGRAQPPRATRAWWTNSTSLGLPHAVQLRRQLFQLPAEIAGSEQLIIRVNGDFHHRSPLRIRQESTRAETTTDPRGVILNPAS